MDADITPVVVICPDATLLTALQAGFSRGQNPMRLLVLREYPRLDQAVGLVRSKGPRAVLISLSLPEPALDLIERLHAIYPDLPLIAVHGANSGELILAAVRSGASRYVGPPFDPGEIRQAMQAAPAAGAGPKGRMVAVMPAVGGAGASTTALHLAAAISQAGAKALLMDFDLPCGALEFQLHFRPDFTLADALERTADLDELWAKLATRWKKLSVLPAPRGWQAGPEIWARTPAVLASARRSFGWVVADLPPALFPYHGEVLAQADEVLLVCTPEPVSIHLARRKLEELSLNGINVRLVVNRLEGRFSWSRQEVEELVGRRVSFTLRNDYAAVRQACMDGGLVDEKQELGRQLRSMARTLIGIREPAETPAQAKGWSGLLERKFPLVEECLSASPGT